ncbi:MAG: YfcC family protein [Chitinophagaceae bacterium]|nr:YfcC family protein [Chitinophagaceae bacterium]
MSVKRALPSPITILMIVIVIASLATWLIPAGQYNRLSYQDNHFVYTTSSGDSVLPATKQTLDSLRIRISLEKFQSGAIRKPVSVPGTYHSLPKNGQGFIRTLQAPLKGIYDTIDIILFVLVIGGFMNVFHESGAMVRGLTSLSHNMKGRESWLIIILTFLFSFAGASYGMAEEALVFYPVMVPLFLAAGYDLLVPVAVIFAGTQLGTLSSFTNPFSTIIASNAAGVNWSDGLYGRILMFLVSTGLTIWYIVRYANKVKKDPSASIVLRIDGEVRSPYESISTQETEVPPLGIRTQLLLLLFLFTFLVMIGGVVWFEWWLLEMSALFLGSSILVALLLRMKEKTYITQFIKGAEGLLSVAFIIGVARGVTVILNEGQISDSILFYSSKLVGGMPPALFIVILLLLYMVFTLFISSSSGMAVLTMPIMGALAIMVNVPGREIVNSYLFGMGIMGFMTPTGLILPSLALVNVSLKAWWRFIFPLLLILLALCSIFLVTGLYL